MPDVCPGTGVMSTRAVRNKNRPITNLLRIQYQDAFYHITLQGNEINGMFKRRAGERTSGTCETEKICF